MALKKHFLFWAKLNWKNAGGKALGAEGKVPDKDFACLR